MAKSASNKNNSSAKIGFEEKLWLAADKPRGTMDASEYKHVVLGLIFLKYISDTFEEFRNFLKTEAENQKSDRFIANTTQREEALEDRDEYLAENVFWVPKDARWSVFQDKAKTPEIGKIIDDAMGVNDAAVKDLGDDTLKKIAQELVTSVRNSVTIDWTLRESARAKIKVMVKRILRRYGYPPDKQETATDTVIMQAEVLCKEWVA